MKRVDVLNQVVESGVVAVVRGTREQAYKTAKACIAGDVKAIELTFTVPEADKVIAQLNEEYGADDEVIIGAGTVMDAITARIAMIAGAKFIVSPTFDKETALLCNKYQVPYMPGCMSVTEIQTAMEYGSDIVKVFPGSVVGNGFVSAVKAPIPYANIMPTGGVNLENVKDWYAKGVVVVGAGSNLVGPADQGDYAAVIANAKKYRAEIQRIKGTK